MNLDQDYDNDGNNIVPCPICLDTYCPSKEKGKCPEEENFKKSFKRKEFQINVNRTTITLDMPEEILEYFKNGTIKLSRASYRDRNDKKVYIPTGDHYWDMKGKELNRLNNVQQEEA